MNPMMGVMGSGGASSTGNVMQITATLRNMPDAQLQQYAAMHKNDPFVFPLAFQESQTRQQMRAGQAAQMAGQKPPPVVDQDLAQMMPTPVTGGAGQAITGGHGQAINALPEEQGIGALNAPNLQQMADGGIAGYADGAPSQPGMFNYAQMAPAVDLHPNSGVTSQNMASGGVARFADEGVVSSQNYSPDVYRRYAIQKAREMGVPPELADSIFRIESGYKPDAKSKTGPVGIGQLTKATGLSYGVQPHERTDGFKNIDASLAFIKDLQGKYNGDPQKVAVAYNQGEPFLNKHLKENEGTLVPEKLNKPEAYNYLKKLGTAVTSIIPSAHAETVPGRAPVNPVDQIPGQTVKAPASNYEQTNTYFGGLADRLGISPEVQRNISNSLNALGGYSSPVSSVGKGVGIASKGLAPTAEMVTKAEQAKNAVALPRIGYSAGIEGLTSEAQAMRDLAIANKQKALLDADRAAALGAEQSVNATTQTSDIARKMEESIANARRVGATAKIPGTEKAVTLGGRLNEAKLSGAAQGLAAMNDMEKMGLSSAPSTNVAGPGEAGWGMDLGQEPPVENAPIPSSTTPSAPTEKTTGEKGGRDWNDTLLHLGLGLMAGQSPHALQNLGNAGLGALKHEQEMKRMTLEERKQAALEDLQKQQGKYLGAQAGYYEDLRGPQAALASADKNFAEWQKNPLHLNAKPEEARAAYQTFIQDAYKNLGIIHPSRISEQAKADVFKYNPQ